MGPAKLAVPLFKDTTSLVPPPLLNPDTKPTSEPVPGTGNRVGVCAVIDLVGAAEVGDPAAFQE